MQIRHELASDHDAVRKIHLSAFGDEHGAHVADLMDDLRNLVVAGAGLSLVAESVGQVVGHIAFTRSWLDAPRRLVEVQVLSPLAVTVEHQNQGIGSALVRRGLHTLSEWAVPVVFLEGEPDYYPRFGFRPGTDIGFTKPSERIPDPAFQALRLPASQPWMSGALVYADVFWRHDLVGLRSEP